MLEDAAPFRARYRAGVSRWYNAFLHAGFVFGFGLAEAAVLFSRVNQPLWWQWSAFVVGLLAFNFGVYFVHRELGHHKRSWARLFYKRHSGDHHSFFLENQIAYEQSRDWRVILFPPWLIVVFGLVFVMPVVGVLSLLVSSNVGLLTGAGLMTGYLLYEFFHTCHHLPDEHWLTRVPWLREMRQMHRLHHRRELMDTKNFNIVFPLADWLFGTYYWEKPRSR